MLEQLKRVKFLSSLFGQEQAQIVLVGQERAHPIQRAEGAQWLYVPEPNLIPQMVLYALNEWVYSAVNKIAETASSAVMEVVSRNDATVRKDEHGLLDLLGRYGKPNDFQDSYEFFESHFVNLDIAGNSFWWWGSGKDGLPGEVHVLAPEKVRIVAGSGRTVEKYVYRDYGREIDLRPEEITHFKRYNPYNRYWGMSALQAVQIAVKGDLGMSKWNADFFHEGHGVPGAVITVSPKVSKDEVERLERELNAKHGGGRRKLMVARAEPGSVAYQQAGLAPKDVDFEKGRILSRRSVYEALNLPLGIMSEASTEAHAIVSQRQFFESVELRHIRTQRKLNSDGMDLWPAAGRWACRFEDIKKRATDWRRESLKISTLLKVMTVDEIRSNEFNLGPMPKEEMAYANNGAVQAETDE